MNFVCVTYDITEVKVAYAATACLGQDEVRRIRIDVQLHIAGAITDDNVMVQMRVIYEYADFVICCLRQLYLLQRHFVDRRQHTRAYCARVI